MTYKGIGECRAITLTKGLDNVPGTSGNDTIIGSIHATDAELKTLSTLDVVNGGAGVDTLKVATDGTAVCLPNMTNVEIVEVESAGAATVDTSAVTGVTNLNVLKAATAVSAKAAATTDINVSLKQGTAVAGAAPTADVKADIAVTGGKNVTVNVTDVKQVLDVVADGSGELNGIVVGGAGAAAAAGTVTVTSTGAKTVAGTNAVLSSVTVTGGSTISVTQKATSDAAAAAADKTGATITQGAVNVTGNATTTTVTVKQDASVNAVAAVDAVANKDETYAITFKALAKGEKIGLTDGTNTITFTASKALTAAEVASAFANLSKNALQGNASTKLGEYTTITTKGLEKWLSGAVETVDADNAKVTFSATGNETTTLADSGSTAGKVTVGAVVGGTTAVTAKAGVLGVANGVVSIVDSNTTGTIKTITVDGYANGSRIGAGNAGGEATDTTSLETLNLSNSGLGYTGAKVTSVAGITVDDTAATLALNLEKVGFSAYYNGDAVTTTVDAAVTLTAAPTTLNVKSTGNNYVDLTANATTTLNVSGTGVFKADLAGTPTLTTIKVTETAGLTLGGVGAAGSLTSVDTTGTTGTVTVSIEANKATYAGGAGVDKVTVGNTAVTKAIKLGAGDDTLNLTAVTKANLEGIAADNVLLGGDGTDTLVLSAANADSTTGVSGAATFEARVDGFEKLEIGQLAAVATVNLVNLDDINYVISNGSAAGAGAGFVSNTKIDGAGAIPGPAVTENNVVVFNGLTAGQSYTVAGRTVYATGAATAAEVAAAFISGASAGNLVVGGTLAGWTVADNGGGSTADALFTSTTASNDVTDLSATSAGVPANLLTLDKMLTGATVELKAAGNVEVKLGTDGAADVVNFVTNAATNTVLGTATADKVETINIEAKDTDVTATATGTANVSTNFLVLDADAAKTVNLTGAGNLTLTLSGDSKEVTLIDGSTATGKLNVTSVKTTAENVVVKGGLAADTLTSAGQNDKLYGNEGADTLKAAGTIALVVLEGGAGTDSFDVSAANAKTAASVVRITDLAKGETIKFVADAGASFLNTKFEMTGGASLSDYVGQALAAADAYSDSLDGAGTGSNGIAWFQQGGNTYIVQDVNDDGLFTATNDIVVELTGLVDLSASSFNDTGAGTLLFI